MGAPSTDPAKQDRTTAASPAGSAAVGPRTDASAAGRDMRLRLVPGREMATAGGTYLQALREWKAAGGKGPRPPRTGIWSGSRLRNLVHVLIGRLGRACCHDILTSSVCYDILMVQDCYDIIT